MYKGQHEDDVIASIVKNERGCKIWPGRHLSGVYPASKVNGVHWRLSRYVLTKKLGRPIREGYYALHECDTPICVEQSHLYEGTPQNNVDDMVSRGRHVCGYPVQKGTDHPHSRLTERHVLAIRSISGIASQTRIAEVFGISREHVGQIIRRDRWKHI